MQCLLLNYFGLQGINNRSDFLKKMRGLEEELSYRRVYCVPKRLHDMFNVIFQGCGLTEIDRKLDSIFGEKDHNLKRQENILKPMYFVAILENRDVSVSKLGSVGEAVQEERLSPAEARREIGISQRLIKQYAEDLFLPRNHQGITKFLCLLEEISRT